MTEQSESSTSTQSPPRSAADAGPPAAEPDREDRALTPETSKKLRRTITGAAVGNIVEQYDFAIYGSMSALVFGTLFFSELGTTGAMLASFSTYAVGFVARPLGGLIAGHFGDIYGRKNLLVLMLMLAGISTTLIGLLPTHAVAGIWAPILLVALRFIQGVSFGGEYGGAVLMVNETAPRARRGFYTGFIPASACVGVVLASLVILLFTLLPDNQFMSWGWRIPFLFAIVLVGIGLVVRLRLEETDAFAETKKEIDVSHEEDGKARWPLMEALKENPKEVLLVTGVCIGFSAVNYLVVAWLLSYLALELDKKPSVGLTGIIIAQVCYAVATLTGSAISDRVGRRAVMMTGSILMMLLSFPLFMLVNTGSAALIWVAMAASLVSLGLIYGPLSSLMCELFATKHRFSGASLSYTLGLTLGGGLSPLIATGLFSATGGTGIISLYIAAAALICAVSTYFVFETANTKLHNT